MGDVKEIAEALTRADAKARIAFRNLRGTLEGPIRRAEQKAEVAFRNLWRELS